MDLYHAGLIAATLQGIFYQVLVGARPRWSVLPDPETRPFVHFELSVGTAARDFAEKDAREMFGGVMITKAPTFLKRRQGADFRGIKAPPGGE